MQVLQDVIDLGSVSGPDDRLLLVREAGAQLFEPSLQLRQQLRRWPPRQQLLTSNEKRREKKGTILSTRKYFEPLIVIHGPRLTQRFSQ